MKKLAILLALVMLLTALSGCGGDKGEASVQQVSMICGMGSAGLADRFAGMVTPQGETNIKTNDGSTVAEIKVKVGDEVIVGQALFTYDMAQTKLDLERGQLELEKLKNTLESYQEQKKMIIGGDESSLLDVREVDVLILQTQYDISVKEKELEKLSSTLKNVTVTSPVAGVVQTINENGAYDDFGNPLPFMTIVETGGYRVKGYINENNAGSLYEGMEVLLRSRVDEKVWHGTVSEIDWNNPAQNSNNYGYMDDDTAMSSKYPFYVALQGSSGLLLGQHVYIEPDYGQDAIDDANTIRMPSWYLCDIEGNPYVWAQGTGGKLEKRNVTLGDYDEMMDTYVIESGLTADDYIAFPDETLVAGMTCVTYDEGNFAADDGMDMGEMDMGSMDMAPMDIPENDMAVSEDGEILMMEEAA